MGYKALHTNFHHGWGGQSNRILTECLGLHQKGHDITISAPADSILIQKAERLGIKVFKENSYSRGFHPLALFREAAAIKNLVLRENFDIIHTHGSQDSWTASLALALIAKGRRPKLIRTKHNLFPIKDHFVNRLHYKAFDAMICISKSILEYCRAKKWMSGFRFYVIHSAVDIEAFDKAPALDVRREFNIDAGRKIIAVVARLRGEKGHRYLIEALPEIILARPEAVFLFIGDGSMKEDLIAAAKKNGVSDKIIFAGFRTDVAAILKGVDVFALPSVSEGLGTSILEAGMASLPVAASNVGGILDIVDDGENGYLFPVGDVSAIAKKIIFMLSNMNEVRAAGARLRKKIEDHFSTENLVANTEECYRDLLGR